MLLHIFRVLLSFLSTKSMQLFVWNAMKVVAYLPEDHFCLFAFQIGFLFHVPLLSFFLVEDCLRRLHICRTMLRKNPIKGHSQKVSDRKAPEIRPSYRSILIIAFQETVLLKSIRSQSKRRWNISMHLTYPSSIMEFQERDHLSPRTLMEQPN